MSLLPMFFKGLTPELMKTAEEELHETPQVKTAALEKFRSLTKEKLGHTLEDELLLKFLRVKKFNVKKSAEVICNYFSFQRQHLGVFTYVRPSQLKHVIQMNIFSYTYYRLPKGAYVALVRVGNYDPGAATAEEVIACALTWTEIILECQSTQIIGGYSVIDVRGANFEQFKTFISISFIKFLLSTLKDCFPLRVRGIHFLNEPYILRVAYGIVKNLGRQKLFEKIHFHGNDLNSLHEHIPKEFLPEDFGGSAETTDKKELQDIFFSHEDFIEGLSKYALKTTQ